MKRVSENLSVRLEAFSKGEDDETRSIGDLGNDLPIYLGLGANRTR
jgi:hypothetical protein